MFRPVSADRTITVMIGESGMSGVCACFKPFDREDLRGTVDDDAPTWFLDIPLNKLG
jgi:hypothetical protein